jgi:phage FluMu protein Com
MNYNFMPMVKCPHCKKVNHPEISGWGSELSTRTKVCRHCEKEYRLVVYAIADLDINVTTARINNYKSRIKYLKQRIYEKLKGIINKHAEWANEYIRIEQSTGGKQN